MPTNQRYLLEKKTWNKRRKSILQANQSKQANDYSCLSAKLYWKCVKLLLKKNNAFQYSHYVLHKLLLIVMKSLLFEHSNLLFQTKHQSTFHQKNIKQLHKRKKTQIQSNKEQKKLYPASTINHRIINFTFFCLLSEIEPVLNVAKYLSKYYMIKLKFWTSKKYLPLF